MKTMDHAAYQSKLKKVAHETLRFILEDAREAVDAQPQGENAGYYMDEVHYAAAELRRREKI